MLVTVNADDELKREKVNSRYEYTECKFTPSDEQFRVVGNQLGRWNFSYFLSQTSECRFAPTQCQVSNANDMPARGSLGSAQCEAPQGRFRKPFRPAEVETRSIYTEWQQTVRSKEQCA